MLTARLIVHPASTLGAGGQPDRMPVRYRLPRGWPVPAELTAPVLDGREAVEATVSYDSGSSKMALFAANRDSQAAIRMRTVTRGVRIVRILKHEVLDGVDPCSADARIAHGAVLDVGGLSVMLAPATWTLLHLAVRVQVPDSSPHRADDPARNAS